MVGCLHNLHREFVWYRLPEGRDLVGLVLGVLRCPDGCEDLLIFAKNCRGHEEEAER